MFYLWQFEGHVPAFVCVETQQIQANSLRFECLGGSVLGGSHRGSDGTAGLEPHGPEGAGPPSMSTRADSLGRVLGAVERTDGPPGQDGKSLWGLRYCFGSVQPRKHTFLFSSSLNRLSF